MFEKIITDVLNRVLGDFIDGLDSKQLNISLLAGDVELFNLSIKNTILDNLPLPFKVKYGKVGRIFVDIPIVSFLSNPIKIEVSDIFLLISPKEGKEWNEDVIKKAFIEGTKSALENLEQYYRGKLELENQEPGVADSIINTVINNLHIEIKNIYARFEDDISYPKVPY
jgi:vacuolar protein sorting-associated protein 13A/C